MCLYSGGEVLTQDGLKVALLDAAVLLNAKLHLLHRALVDSIEELPDTFNSAVVRAKASPAASRVNSILNSSCYCTFDVAAAVATSDHCRIVWVGVSSCFRW